jgi:hypothetical protein
MVHTLRDERHAIAVRKPGLVGGGSFEEDGLGARQQAVLRRQELRREKAGALRRRLWDMFRYEADSDCQNAMNGPACLPIVTLLSAV